MRCRLTTGCTRRWAAELSRDTEVGARPPRVSRRVRRTPSPIRNGEVMPGEHSDRTSDRPVGGVSGAFPHLRELTTDALHYWEPRRLVYNLILAAVVLGHFVSAWPSSRSVVTFDGALGVFILAVLANVAFSTVYIADVFIQLSGFRDSRTVWRWLLLVVGFAFAAVLTHFMSGGMFPVQKAV